MTRLDDSPILEMKAVKNEAEISGMIEAHIKDAVAFSDWAAFMEDQIQVEGATNWTEISAASLLSQYRLEQEVCNSSERVKELTDNTRIAEETALEPFLPMEPTVRSSTIPPQQRQTPPSPLTVSIWSTGQASALLSQM